MLQIDSSVNVLPLPIALLILKVNFASSALFYYILQSGTLARTQYLMLNQILSRHRPPFNLNLSAPFKLMLMDLPPHAS